MVTWRARGLQRVVNVEQAPKRLMRKPTRQKRGRLAWPGKRAMDATSHSAGVMTAARVYREIDATREVPWGERRCPLNWQPARVRPGLLGWRTGSYDR